MNKRMLRHISQFTLLSVFISSAYAVAPGFYMGGMFGPATNSGSSTRAQTSSTPPTTTPVTPKSTQYGTSVYLGYKASQYFGSEYGFTYYSGIDYDTKGVDTCSAVNTRVRDLHALLTGAFPLKSVSVFAKAGVAVVYQTTAGALNPDLSSGCGKSSNTNKVAPSFAIGIGYDMTQNWVADASINRLQAGGAAGNIDWFALGVSYHFVDKYCGQFLC